MQGRGASSLRQTQYFFDLTYSICIQLVKGSIVIFYYRIFQLTPRFRYAVYAIGGLLICIWTSGVLVAIFSCTPIYYFWDMSGDGRCINSYAFIVAEAGLSIFTDLVILLLPMPLVWRLKVTLKQKVGLTGIFLLGGLYGPGASV